MPLSPPTDRRPTFPTFHPPRVGRRALGPVTAMLACVACGTLGSAAERPADVDITAPAIVPREKIVLYDGKTVADLRHFYTWLGDKRYDDPNGVFSVVPDVDGAPAIRISGQDWGGLITRKNYRDYRLTLEYRWSDKTWNSRARNSGILFHARGEDGNVKPDFRSTWLSSVEYEIQEGRTGTVILVPGFGPDGTRTYPSIVMRTKQDQIWDPEGEPKTFTGGFLFHSTYDRSWKDVLGFRGADDVDKPIGEWNRVEYIAKGGDITYFLNGTKIFEATEGSFTEGRIMFQSEGAEIFFRQIELHPLEDR